MLRLKPEVRSKLLDLLRSGECEKARKLIRDIGSAYMAIDRFFKAESEFVVGLDLDPNEVIVANKCVDRSELEISIYASLSYNTDYGSQGYRLCRDYDEMDEMMESDMYMVIEGLDTKTLIDIFKTILESKTIGWLTVLEHGRIPGKQWRNILSREKADYWIKLEEKEYAPKAWIDNIECVYRGEITEKGIKIHLFSRVFEGRYSFPSIESINESISIADNISRKYKSCNPTITLIFTPYC